MSGVFRSIDPSPPSPRGGGEDTLAGWRGGWGSIVRKTPDTMLCTLYHICKYFVYVPYVAHCLLLLEKALFFISMFTHSSFHFLIYPPPPQTAGITFYSTKLCVIQFSSVFLDILFPSSLFYSVSIAVFLFLPLPLSLYLFFLLSVSLPSLSLLFLSVLSLSLSLIFPLFPSPFTHLTFYSLFFFALSFFFSFFSATVFL
jgi:hypothetical protein